MDFEYFRKVWKYLVERRSWNCKDWGGVCYFFEEEVCFYGVLVCLRVVFVILFKEMDRDYCVLGNIGMEELFLFYRYMSFLVFCLFVVCKGVRFSF